MASATRNAQAALREILQAVPEAERGKYMEHFRLLDTMLLQVADVLQALRPLISAANDVHLSDERIARREEGDR